MLEVTSRLSWFCRCFRLRFLTQFKWMLHRWNALAVYSLFSECTTSDTQNRLMEVLSTHRCCWNQWDFCFRCMKYHKNAKRVGKSSS